MAKVHGRTIGSLETVSSTRDHGQESGAQQRRGLLLKLNLKTVSAQVRLKVGRLMEATSLRWRRYRLHPVDVGPFWLLWT